MKVLQINTTVNSGSTGRITEGVGQVLIDQNHESYIAYGRGNRPSNSELIKIGKQRDVYFHGIKTLLFDRHGFGSASVTRALIKRIHKIKPDVIGLHNLHGYYVHIGILFNYLQEIKTPVIWTLHDSWAYTGHCTYYDSVGCVKWKTECNNCPKTHLYPQSLGIDQSTNNFEDKKSLYQTYPKLTIVTPSKWLKGEVKSSFLKEHSVNVIHNGIDLNVFKFAKEKKSKLILGVANTWDLRKGLNDFVLLRKELSPDWEITLIGLSKKQINALPEGIKGIKRTENIEELVSWYNKATVFLNPTYQDNFPTTNLEALACGTPVITYNTGGSPEAIDENTGRVVVKRDIKGVINAIKELEEMPQDKLSIDCRNRAKKYFDKNDRYQDYLHLYEKLLNEKAN